MHPRFVRDAEEHRHRCKTWAAIYVGVSFLVLARLFRCLHAARSRRVEEHSHPSLSHLAIEGMDVLTGHRVKYVDREAEFVLEISRFPPSEFSRIMRTLACTTSPTSRLRSLERARIRRRPHPSGTLAHTCLQAMLYPSGLSPSIYKDRTSAVGPHF